MVSASALVGLAAVGMSAAIAYKVYVAPTGGAISPITPVQITMPEITMPEIKMPDIGISTVMPRITMPSIPMPTVEGVTQIIQPVLDKVPDPGETAEWLQQQIDAAYRRAREEAEALLQAVVGEPGVAPEPLPTVIGGAVGRVVAPGPEGFLTEETKLKLFGREPTGVYQFLEPVVERVETVVERVPTREEMQSWVSSGINRLEQTGAGAVDYVADKGKEVVIDVITDLVSPIKYLFF